MSINGDVPVSDHALVVAARAGCVESFERLFNQYHPRILAYFVRRTADRELAADLAQQTFIDAFRFIDRLAHADSISAWLYGVARNKLREEWRWQRMHKVLSLEWICEHSGEGVELMRDDHTHTCEERDTIHQALHNLTPALHDALLLYSIGGYASKEIARMLGIADATVRQRIARA
ncbi:RNA polymerase sigma factor [Kallotenue papyrolyticum]|uniref:RNA polymerase sigma factor n=1 Tax=Kallotenue papyrolyticum TaxID=1325125 RepID=UPI0009DF1158|nr:RNA polymerase sigma factor [Kallotenue papyrolyticum]